MNRCLGEAFPNAHCELDYRTPLDLLVAVILSAQCTDERVNQVTPELFRRYPTAADYAGADRAELEELIRPTGFFRNKANALIDRKSTRLNSSHVKISYAVFCLKKKRQQQADR